MKIKIDDDIVEIEYPTFIEWIRTGRITADNLVFSRFVTDGQWMRAGDIRIFKLFSQDTDLRQAGSPASSPARAETKPIETVKPLAPEEVHFLLFQRGLPRLTLVLIAVNVFIFILQSIAGGSTDLEVLIRFGAYSYPLILYHGEYWRILTHIFLHIGLPHLLVNMGVLFIVGMVLEGLYGKERFFIIYFIAGLVGGIASLFIVREEIGGGASGAIFGLIGTVIVFGIRYNNKIPKRFKRGFGLWLLPFLVIDLILGFITPNINKSAHIGGLLGGAAAALFLTPRVFHLPEIRERESLQIKITTYAIIAVLSISMAAAALDTLAGGSTLEEHIIPKYEKTIELNPKDPNDAVWYNNLAWTYVQRNINPKEAIYLAQIALKLKPDNAAYLDTLAWAYLKNGQYEHSLSVFEEVFEIDLEMKSSWDGVLELASSKVDRKAFLDFYKRMSKKAPEGSEMRAKLESALHATL